MLGHTPVLAEEVIQFLDPRPGGRFIDVTVGAGGHSRAILELTAPDGKLLAIDQDESAIEMGRASLASFGSRLVFAKANFRGKQPDHRASLVCKSLVRGLPSVRLR